MFFRPTVNLKIALSVGEYHFTEHPAAKGMLYGQTGRRATVYQVQDSHGQLHALKVFTNAFRTVQTETSAQRIAAFANLPGLQVCSRTVLTHQNAASLLGQYPDLEYAVLMPWVAGQTWQEILLARQPLTPEQSLNLARSFASILATMEQNQIAHCDLSGPNVLVSSANVALVDVEDLFAPSLDQPAKLPGGSAGYGHKTASRGLWRADADRFSGAVLLAEMLAWCDERVRRIAVGEQYFDLGEPQENCDRYQLLSLSLKEKWGDAVLTLLERAWHSQNLLDCPTLAEWQSALLALQQQASRAQELSAPLPSGGPVVRWRNIASEPASQPAQSSPVAALLKTAETLAAQGNLEGALGVLRQAKDLASQAELAEINEKMFKLYSRQNFSTPPKPSQSNSFAPPMPDLVAVSSALDDDCNAAIRLFNTKNFSGAEEIFRKIYANNPDFKSREGTKITYWLTECEKKNRKKGPLGWAFIVLTICIIGLISFAVWKYQTQPQETKTAQPVTYFLPTETKPLVPSAAINLPPQITENGALMVLVPEGQFTMGIDPEEALAVCQKYRTDCTIDWFNGEGPAHKVLLDNYYIDKYEVSNLRYQECVNEGACQPPLETSSYTRSEYYRNPEFDSYPVINVTWSMAKTYCEWRNARLPTEAEWEKAARGIASLIFPWGGTLDEDRVNFCDQNCTFDWKDDARNDGYSDTAPIDAYTGGASPYGIINMAGNVWEWVYDFYAENYYAGMTSISKNPTGPATGDLHVLRGGGWYSHSFYLMTTQRALLYPASITYHYSGVGIRCASSPSQ